MVRDVKWLKFTNKFPAWNMPKTQIGGASMKMRQYHIQYPLAMDEVWRLFQRNSPEHLRPLDLGRGVSSFNVLNHIDLRLTQGELRKHTAYGDINGLPSLRAGIARLYAEQFDYELDPRRICITDGASGALMLVYALLSGNGQQVILPDASFPIYRIYANLFKMQYQLAPLHPENQHVDLAALERKITPDVAAVLINSPSNPHGAVLTAEELATLAALPVPVIFDEVYQALPLHDRIIPSAITYSKNNFIVNSFSKSMAIAGFRLGYLIVPESYIEQVSNAKASINVCTSLPSQLIGELLLRKWDELISKHRSMLQKNWREMQRQVAYHSLPLRSMPEAGFFASFDTHGTGKDSMRVAVDLVEQHALNSVPGIDFASLDPNFIRLNFACPHEDIAPAMERLAAYLQCQDP
jgi:aspartate/methionine/tyrosine aminotransferase